MLHYFYLLDRSWLTGVLHPALASGWRQRSFAPCQPLCRDLAARRAIPEDAVVRAVLAGIGFDRRLWQALIGECLIFSADDLPRIPGMIDALVCLLAPHRRGADRAARAALTPIEQVYLGTRDLRFAGGWHRPEHVGWNATEDVGRLAAYLQSIDVSRWTADALTPLADLPDAAEREEDLAFVRDWWPKLVEMYVNAQEKGQVVVCERV